MTSRTSDSSSTQRFSDEVEPAGEAERLGLEAAREMRRRWRRGEQTAAEELLSERPELWQHLDAVVDLIYEEYCLRRDSGEQNVEQDILRRFPQLTGPLEVMLDCHRRLLESESTPPRFPAVGDAVGEFELLSELGRGSHGRVFVARQTALGDRPMVLKVTPLGGGEHLSLARLQHTNIVPLYAVVDDAAQGIRILCMPYFGRATLATLLGSLANIPLHLRTGHHIGAAIDCMQDASPLPATISGPARLMLDRVSFVQGVCWIVACLADALQFAHERGLVHLDLKPSNVLLASDGQPMLLDFHLAREPVRPDGAVPENLGGTRPYMPPEQHAAMRALRDGHAVETMVERRADIYALGAMLYECLGGQLPFEDDSPPLRKLNPHVSAGLSDIVAKCLAHRPDDRYADAKALASDLRRHLTDMPLTGVSNRSIAERWEKWRRRHPSRLRAAGLLAAVLVVAGLLLGSVWAHLLDRQRQAEQALYDGERQLQTDRNPSEVLQTFERGVDLLKSLPFEDNLRQQLATQVNTAKRLVLIDSVHQLADEVRVLYGNTDGIPVTRLQSLDSKCRALWNKRDVIMRSVGGMPSADLPSDLQDIAIFAASLQLKISPDPTAARREALRMLDEAAAMFGAGAVLENERQSHRAALGISVPSSSPSARTAWEHEALGRAFLASGDLSRASKELSAARQLEPTGLWTNFYYGLFAYRVGRYDDAADAFSVCIGAAPNVGACFYNRALAYVGLGRTQQALNDYDRVLQLDPTNATAARNREALRQHATAR